MRLDRPASILCAVAMVVAACGSATAPTTAPVSPSPQATPSPVSSAAPSADPAEVALAALADPEFTARVTIKGTETVPSGMWAASPGGTPHPIGSAAPTLISYEGEAYVAGSDYIVRLQVADQETVASGELRRGRSVWRRDGTEEWHALPAPDDSTAPRLFGLLATLPTLERIGELTNDGGSLIRYRAPSSTPLSLATIFLRPVAQHEPDVGTLEVDTKPDGTPVRVAVELTSDDFSAAEATAAPIPVQLPPRTYAFTFDLEPADAVPLPDPSTATARFESRFGLSFDHPADWTPDTSAPDADVVQGGAVIVVNRFSRSDLEGAPDDPDGLLQAYARWVVDSLRGEGATIDTIEATKVAGLPAYLVAAHGTMDAEPYFRLEGVFVRESSMYSIFWIERPGSELASRFDFERLLASVRLDD
jgi:hypothetical protein